MRPIYIYDTLPPELKNGNLKMSKAQTDIRSTSYDALSARPFGYQGTIDEVIAQIRAEDYLLESRYRYAFRIQALRKALDPSRRGFY